MSDDYSYGARVFAVIFALVAVAIVLIAAAAVAREERQHEQYRQLVRLCATTADDQSEFRACVKEAE